MQDIMSKLLEELQNQEKMNKELSAELQKVERMNIELMRDCNQKLKIMEEKYQELLKQLEEKL